MIIPSNYRQVKSTDTVREGDIYRNKTDFNDVGFARYSIGRLAGDNSGYTFWRARKSTAVTSQVAKPATASKPSTSKKIVALVAFEYPKKNGGVKLRVVQLISLDTDYLTGLEKNWTPDGYKYQFKRYLRSKIVGRNIYLTQFGPAQ